jgi:hypothetical protein
MDLPELAKSEIGKIKAAKVRAQSAWERLGIYIAAVVSFGLGVVVGYLI